MFRLQVTIIKQTFQYMDMTCAVLTVWDPTLFTCKQRGIPDCKSAPPYPVTTPMLLCLEPLLRSSWVKKIVKFSL